MEKKLLKFILASVLMAGVLTGCNDNPNNPDNPKDPDVNDPVDDPKDDPKDDPTPAKYTVTYDANGGSGTAVTDLNEYDSGTKVTVKENTFTAPEGKEFINWNEEADGSGSYHNANSTFKIYENITLYAQWLDVEIHPIVDPDDPDAEYNIKVSVPTGITYTLSADKAKRDTTVTLTLAVSSGITLNGDPTSSQVTLTKTKDLTYSFTMPANAVSITVKGTVDGDVVLTGDITAKLTDADKDGIYTAEVACDDKTSYNFTYVVKDGSGSAKRLSSMKLDETRTDANVTFTSGDNQLMIAGGCTYVFSYDSNKADYNCFITRKSVDVLPSNSKTLYNLFDGRLRSQSTIHPQGLTSIHYEKKINGADTEQGYKVTDETYDYKKISNTESFAVSKDNSTGENSYVYKNIDTATNVYSVVNTYRKSRAADNSIIGNNEADDNVWNLDPYGEMQGERYFPYAARQDIVANSLYRDTTRYQITEREAYRNVSSAAHYGDVLEYEIWKAIRGDYDGTATINAANAAGSHISIVSTPRSGGFTVALDGQLEYNHEESGSTADVTQQYAFIYKATMVFLTNGDLYSLDYTEKYYSKVNWDFTAHAPLAGGAPITKTIKVNNKFNETFARATVLGDFNPSIYFISSIDSLSFYDADTKISKSSSESILNFDDSLAIYDYLGGGETSKYVEKFEFSPATALDGWQYGFISTKDKGVADNTAYGPKTVGVGTTTVTFGNKITGMATPTKDVTVSVYAGGTFHSLFVNCTIAGYDSYQGDHADYMYGYAGKTMSFYIDSSVNTGCPVTYYMVFKEKNKFGDISYTTSSKYFNVLNGVGTEHDDDLNKDFTKIVGHELKLDFNTDAANALTSSVTVDIVFMSNYYADGFGPTTLHVVVGKPQTSVANTKWACTYLYNAEDDPTLEGKKFEDVTCEFLAGGVGKITEVLYSKTGEVTYTNIYNFAYTEANNGSLSVYITSVVMEEPDMPKTASSYDIYMERTKGGQLGIALYTEDTDIFGSVSEDEEGYITVEGLTAFDQVIE